MTGSALEEADEAADTWVAAPAGRLPGDIAARIRAAREAGVEERHIRLILAEAFVASAAVGRLDQGRVGA